MHDVVIVGAGPVGLFLATLLAQRGVDVVVLDRRAEPSGSSRAIGIHPPSLHALASVGLAARVLDECVVIRTGVARAGGHTLGALSLDAASPRYPFVVSLPQHRSEALLTGRLVQLAPAALRRGVRVVGLRQSAGHVSVRCEHGDEVDARFAVAADGAHSFLRHAVGIRATVRPYRHAYVMGDFADDTDDGPVAVVHLERDGVVESFPLPGRTRRWVVRTRELHGGATPASLAALIEERTGARIDASSNSMLSTFTVQRRLPDRLVAGRVVLVGDAAHELSPIGGQGMNLGWLDAVALAPLLVSALADRGPDPLKLRRWEAERRRSVRTAARLSEANMALGRPARGLTLALRNALVVALLHSPLGRVLGHAYAMGWTGQRMRS